MLLTGGSYKVIGRANNKDYVVRKMGGNRFLLGPIEEVGLPMTISGSSKHGFKVGEYVNFDEGLGRFTRNTDGVNPAEVIAYYRKLSGYVVAVQSELSKKY